MSRHGSDQMHCGPLFLDVCGRSEEWENVGRQQLVEQDRLGDGNKLGNGQDGTLSYNRSRMRK